MESDRYLLFHLDDIIVQPTEAAEVVLSSCKRGIPYCPQAICQYEEEILVTLQNCSAGQIPDELRWIDISQVPFRELTSLLQERWKSGFEPVGTVTSSPDYQPQKRFLLVMRRGGIAE